MGGDLGAGPELDLFFLACEYLKISQEELESGDAEDSMAFHPGPAASVT